MTDKNKSVSRIIMAALLSATLVGVAVYGCSGSSEAPHVTLDEGPVVEQPAVPPAPSLPAWRSIDRLALVAGLGWGEVARGNTAIPRVALTFDAGSEGEPVPAILDILKGAGLHCTFFLSGQFVADYPELVTRMAAENHEIANHSYSHPDFTTISAEDAHSQLARTDAAITALTGSSSKPYFRFPYGRRNNAMVDLVNADGYMSVSWTVDAYDWEPSRTPQQIYSRVMGGIGPGAIVLMHCGSAQEVEILPVIMRDLQAQGYQLVTVTEVLSP